MAKSSQFIALFLFSIFFFTKTSQAIDLQFPVACKPMQNCWITNHVDLNTRTGVIEDYMCGVKTYDNSPATHISLGTSNAQDKNVPVIAAASGTVILARDIGQECGTRVVINHGKGWHTSYCHLNPETLFVQQGMTVEQGQILGIVGTSGQTNWPRLSFVVTRNNMIFDPFSGRSELEGCLPNANPMWIGGMNPFYEPANVTRVGFTVGHLSNRDIASGALPAAAQILNETPQLSLWAMMLNIKKDDVIEMLIVKPSGEVLNETKITASRDQVTYPLYLSTNRGLERWKPGLYTGKITITRRVQNGKITTGKKTMVELVTLPSIND